MKIQKKQEIEFFGTKTGNANSIALGYATETKNFGEVAVGVMNKSTAAKDPNSSKGVCVDPDATLFSVGCGGSGERKNALEVKGDGSVIIPGENGNINIADKIKQAFDTDASIELVKSAEDSLQYTLMVNNESRGSINIPKDQFLKNVTYDSEGKQLVFTFVTLDEDEHVERVPVGDLKDIYTAGEGINIDNNVISADFSSVMTAISDEKTQRETADNEIKSTLDTKADKTDVDNRLDNLRNRCFRLSSGGISAPYSESIGIFKRKILKLNNKEYSYADLNYNIQSDRMYIYDATIDSFIKITKQEFFHFDTYSIIFNTDEPLNLTHKFYFDNEKTGNVESLKKLIIKEDDIFANITYLCTNSNESLKYIYDATDNNWISVVEIYPTYGYSAFNTEISLDLTDKLYYSLYPTFLVNWPIVGDNSIALGSGASAERDNSIALGNYAKIYSMYSIAIGDTTSINGYKSIAIGRNISVNGDNCICLGNFIDLYKNGSIVIGQDTNNVGEHSIILGNSVNRVNDYSVVLGYNAESDGKYSLALGYHSNTIGDYAIALGKNVSNTKSIFGVGFNGVNGIDMDRDNYGLYLKGFGGYDGTNLVINSGDTETLNPNIKSVQEVINEKADASAIPTKISQLTNDSNFITSYTETDPVWTREKTNYYTKTEIDNKGYLTQHQPLDNYVTKSTADANYLSLVNGGDIKNEVTISKANATNDDYTLHLANEGLYIGQDNGLYSIVAITPNNFAYRDFLFYVDENQFTFGNCFAVKRNDENNGGKNTIQLGKVLITESSLSRLNLALDNITAASTAEEVVTKFNALLADLKNKGLMEADVTA